MERVRGGCHCGNVCVDMELAREPVTYRPRACDCDFCRKHGAAYVSDPQGSLGILVQDAASMGNYRQGSGAAEFIFCRNCGVLIGALYRSDRRIWGVINARIVESRTSFGTEEVASPKALSGNEKEKRWRDSWFSAVTIEEKAR